jgi:hypothetical protein
MAFPEANAEMFMLHIMMNITAESGDFNFIMFFLLISVIY